MVRNSVTYTSNQKYDCDWRRWRTFLTKCWEQCSEDDLYLQALNNKQKVELLIAYGHYCLSEHRPGNPLAASTIAGSFSGIRHSFKANVLETDFFDHGSLRAFKTSTVLAERKNEDHNRVRRRKFPMTLGMVDKIRRRARHEGIGAVMCATAIEMAFFCLLRVSEYVPKVTKKKNESCHAMLAKDVLFEVALSDGSMRMLESTQVTAEMWPRVKLVKFTLRSMKNDQLRIGSTFWFRNLPDEEGINIVREVFEWAVLAKSHRDDFFMSYRRSKGRHMASTVTCLKYTTVSTTIKDCAQRCHLDRRDFGTHSPRIGGACTLRAGDAPETMVQLLGKWRGDTSSWVYQESSMKEFDRMQRIIRNPNLFTLTDIQLSYERTLRHSHSFAS
jgi:hypothetical protein